MSYCYYDMLSGPSESRLAELLSEKVNEYINEQNSTLRRLRREMEELRQHHTMSTRAMSFNHKVGTVVAHADHVTLQYRAS